MKKIVTAILAGVAMTATAFASLAGEGEGVIASVDAETRTIVLQDGSTWTAADDVDLAALAPGDAIKVVYEDGTTVLTSVEKTAM